MGYSIGPARVALTIFDGRGLTVEGYETVDALIEHRVCHVALKGSSWGSPEHLAALHALRAKLDTAIAQAAASLAEDQEHEARWPKGRCVCENADGVRCVRSLDPNSGAGVCTECAEDLGKWDCRVCEIPPEPPAELPAADPVTGAYEILRAEAPEEGSFGAHSIRDRRQLDIYAWVAETFGPGSQQPDERVRRFLEEALELAQAQGLSRAKVERLADYVYSRPAGEVAQEVGGVGVTLLAYCESVGVSADAAEAKELHRAHLATASIRVRHEDKVRAGVASPTLHLHKDKPE